MLKIPQETNTNLARPMNNTGKPMMPNQTINPSMPYQPAYETTYVMQNGQSPQIYQRLI